MYFVMAKMNVLRLLNRQLSGYCRSGNVLSGGSSWLRLGCHWIDVDKSYSTMSKPKLYITRPDIPEAGVKLLRETFEISTWTKNEPVPRDELLKNIEGKDALLCVLSDRIDQELLNCAGPNLKTIATMSVGYDHIDVEEIKKRNIRAGYTPEILTDATAELTVGLLLATSRRLIEASEEAKNGGWKAWAPVWMCGQGLSGSTVGIVGFGRIGQQVARRLKPFNVAKILYHNRSEKKEAAQEIGAEKVPFNELVARSDFICVHCALTPETKHLFSEQVFDNMKENAILINTSRGTIVDQDALIKALKCGSIAAAGLDVTTPEPLPLDSPLLKMKNCVVLPHIGSATTSTREDMAVLTAKNLLAGISGATLPAEI